MHNLQFFFLFFFSHSSAFLCHPLNVSLGQQSVFGLLFMTTDCQIEGTNERSNQSEVQMTNLCKLWIVTRVSVICSTFLIMSTRRQNRLTDRWRHDDILVGHAVYKYQIWQRQLQNKEFNKIKTKSHSRTCTFFFTFTTQAKTWQTLRICRLIFRLCFRFTLWSTLLCGKSLNSDIQNSWFYFGS